ncbi:7093_t:CDS:1, partial [Scutellospora calospora]
MVEQTRKTAKHRETYSESHDQGPKGDKKEEVTKVTACNSELRQ